MPIIYHITNVRNIQNTIVHATTELRTFITFTVLPVGALLNKQKQLMACLRQQGLTSLFLGLGTAFGVVDARHYRLG
jgi:hypothetical protein